MVQESVEMEGKETRQRREEDLLQLTFRIWQPWHVFNCVSAILRLSNETISCGQY